MSTQYNDEIGARPAHARPVPPPSPAWEERMTPAEREREVKTSQRVKHAKLCREGKRLLPLAIARFGAYRSTTPQGQAVINLAREIRLSPGGHNYQTLRYWAEQVAYWLNA